MDALGIWDTSLHQNNRSECEDQAGNRGGKKPLPVAMPRATLHTPFSPRHHVPPTMPTFSERRGWENTMQHGRWQGLSQGAEAGP